MKLTFKRLFQSAIAGVINLSITTTAVAAPMSATETAPAATQTFAEAVSEVKYLLANNLIEPIEAVATFSSKLSKLEEQKINVLEEAKNYAMANAKSPTEMKKIQLQFDAGLKQIAQINAKAEADANKLSKGDDIDEVKVAAIMKNARAKISVVSAGLMDSVLKSSTGAHFLGCSEINTKMWVGMGVVVLGAAITVVGLSKALLTEKGIIRKHDRARKRVEKHINKLIEATQWAYDHNTAEKARLESELAYLQSLKDQGMTHYTDDKGNYWNIDSKMAELNTDLYWANEELGNIPMYWDEIYWDRYYEMQKLDESQVEQIEKLATTNKAGYILSSVGAAVMTAGVVTGSLGLKQCK